MGRMGFCDSDEDEGGTGGCGTGLDGNAELGDGELRARASTVPCAQLEAVWQVMRDGLWYGLEEIAVLADCAPASASARLRDLRKEKFGGWTVERDYAGGKQWRYRVREKADAVGTAMASPASSSQAASSMAASSAMVSSTVVPSTVVSSAVVLASWSKAASSIAGVPLASTASDGSASSAAEAASDGAAASAAASGIEPAKAAIVAGDDGSEAASAVAANLVATDGAARGGR